MKQVDLQNLFRKPPIFMASTAWLLLEGQRKVLNAETLEGQSQSKALES
jgi:hypothetical protein